MTLKGDVRPGSSEGLRASVLLCSLPPLQLDPGAPCLPLGQHAETPFQPEMLGPMQQQSCAEHTGVLGNKGVSVKENPAGSVYHTAPTSAPQQQGGRARGEFTQLETPVPMCAPLRISCIVIIRVFLLFPTAETSSLEMWLNVQWLHFHCFPLLCQTGAGEIGKVTLRGTVGSQLLVAALQATLWSTLSWYQPLNNLMPALSKPLP